MEVHMAVKRIYSAKRYNQKSLMREREFGFYWYSWLWNFLHPVYVFLCALVIVLGLAVNAYTSIYNNFFKPMDVNDTTTVNFVIESGQSINTIGDNLLKQGLLRNRGIFKYMIMFEGLTNKVQYGSYQISPSMTTSEIISVLTSGSSSTERTITIIPGWTVEDIADYFVRIEALETKDEFLALCNDVTQFSGYYVIQEAAQAHTLRGRKYILEGYLAPDTYRVFTTADAKSLLITLLNQTDVVVDKVFNASNVPDGAYVSQLTNDQTIIMASIIEREASRASDYRKLSAVLHNRLNAGMTLDCDSTVVYALGIDSTYLLTADQLGVDSPFNTYARTGLPVGPICSPSKAAIEAALYPDTNYIQQNYLYFCAGDPEKNELIFSATLPEHEEAVATYRPIWEAYEAAQKEKANNPAPQQ